MDNWTSQVHWVIESYLCDWQVRRIRIISATDITCAHCQMASWKMHFWGGWALTKRTAKTSKLHSSFQWLFFGFLLRPISVRYDRYRVYPLVNLMSLWNKQLAGVLVCVLPSQCCAPLLSLTSTESARGKVPASLGCPRIITKLSVITERESW